VVSLQDEYFHDRNHPRWGEWDRDHWFNESGWFNFSVPERDISGIMYVHHRPNHGVVWAGTALWDPSGDRRNSCLFQDWRLHPAPPGIQDTGNGVFDFALDNSLRFSTVEPLKAYEFSYDRDRFKADLRWEAFREPVDLGVIPNEWSGWCSGHYEQFGRMTGEITINGETLAVNTFAARDRSFGPHRMNKMGRGNFPWGIADEDHGFFPYVLSDQDPDHDPLFGTLDPIRGGWLLRDGTIAKLVSGERTVERGADTRPLHEHISGTDELGRTFTAEGDVRNHLFFDGFTDNWWWWSMVKWDLDGVPAIGETQDTCPTEMWSRIHGALARDVAVPGR
jgi:hypothetical protein